LLCGGNSSEPHSKPAIKWVQCGYAEGSMRVQRGLSH